VSLVSPAKTDEHIEMLFGMWTQVGPRNHVLFVDGVQIPRCKRGNFEGREGAAHCKVWGFFAVSSAKTAEPT